VALVIVKRDQVPLARPIETRLQPRDSTPVVGITFHITATGAGDPLGTWRTIQAEAMSGHLPSGDVYGDIPYHDGISQDGRIIQGRDHRWVGAHATSSANIANRVTDGVAIIGTGAGLSDAAKQAIRAYVYLWSLGHKRRPVLFDHKDWRAVGGIATACPDPAVEAFVQQLRNEARAVH
jgi:hypothetical protein